MRWVVLTDDHPPQLGGVATWTAWAVQALRTRHHVQVFARARPGLTERGVRGPSFGRWGPLWLPLAARRSLATADAVLATTLPLARYLRVFAPQARIHAVAHGSEVTRRSYRPRVDRLWAVSDFLAGELDGARWLPTPLPAGRARDPRGERWLFVARALEQKGGDRFVRLVAAAGVEADLVGAGPALGGWRRLARELEARVRFHGALDRDAVAALRRGASTAFLLSRADPDGSGAEGLGLTLLEARADGLLAVGCPTGGIPEAVGPGVVLDDPDDVARSLAQLRTHPVRPDPVHQTHAPDAFLAALCG